MENICSQNATLTPYRKLLERLLWATLAMAGIGNITRTGKKPASLLTDLTGKTNTSGELSNSAMGRKEEMRNQVTEEANPK
jgi:hypothetical protein